MKFKGLLLIALIVLSINTTLATDNKFKVIKVIDGDTFYVDFNNNAIAEKDEKVRVNGVDTFEVKPTEFLEYQVKNYGLTQDEALGLGYLGKEFAKKQLLNKYVAVKYTGETERCDMGRHLVSIYYDGKNYGETSERNKNAILNFRASKPKDRRSYEQEVLKTGLAVVYQKSNLAPQLQRFENLDKIKAHAKSTHRLHLVLLNKKNGKYHKPTCEYGLQASSVELMDKKDLPQNSQLAACCNDKNKNNVIPEEAKKVNEVDSPARKGYVRPIRDKIHKRPEKPVPDVKTQNFELYFIDGFKYKKPANYARTHAVQALIKEIDNAQESVDFAVFGFSSQPELLKSLIKAKERGVQVRWVVDMTPWNFNFYGGTKQAQKALPTYVTDYITDKRLLEENIAKGRTTYNGTLNHNKYFVIDKKVVWTGSTNISSSCSGGYNVNITGIIRSNEIANLYTKDFEKMYVQKLFHKDKPILSKENIELDDGSIAKVFFSPNPKILTDGILPVIDNAKEYVYMPIFYLTSAPIFQALQNAQKRGVDVKIIVDAHYANTMHSKIDELRALGLEVKAENWGGKMHMKSLVSDDKYIIFGSCNFTNTGINQNDENLVVVENKILATKFKEKFNQYWAIIPEKWSQQTPQAEGPDSPGSCNDGLDNNHNGLVDKADPNCRKCKWLNCN